MNLDVAATFWLNGFAGRWPVLDAVGVFAATGLLFVLAGLVVFVLVRTPPAARALVTVELIGTLVIAYAISQFIGVVAFRERPFVRHQEIRQLIVKDAREKSFPSDHAMLAFALAIPATAAVRRRWMRALLLVSAALVGIGRVFVGVHYVSDIIAGAFLAFVVWWFVHRGVQRWWKIKNAART
jgi:undecaprenyl-diphosphatase